MIDNRLRNTLLYIIDLAQTPFCRPNTPCVHRRAAQLHMDDLWLVAEVQSLLKSGVLQEPVDGHVVQPVHVEMGEMNLGACEEETQARQCKEKYAGEQKRERERNDYLVLQ